MTQGRESTDRARPAELASSSHGQREAHHASEPAQKVLQTLEQALQASEARFRNIIDKSADGVVVVHTDGVISFVNRAAQAMLDRKADQLVGQHFGVPTVPGQTTEIDILSPSSQAARVAEMRVVETEWDATPSYLATLRDVTDRKGAELDNARLYEESQEAVRRRDEFLAMLSHELRNPLASIVNAAAVIRLLGAHDDSIDEARDVIERQGRHMTRLLDDLLDLSRITRGKISLCTQPLSFSSPLTNAIEACRPMLEAKGHELQISLPDEDMVLLADSTRLEQVFGNLLANAAKYTPPGGRICVTAARNEKHCVIRIEDNGMGIAPDSLAKIFEPFFQSDRSLDRSGGGLGIGLTLVRRIVELHGGIVTVTSAGPGQGSQFEVRLPLAPQASRRRGKKSAKAASTGRRILIIEDNHDGRDILRSLLELSGHEVEVARDGREGLEAIRSGLPDVALVDIGLPLLNGHEIARRVRSSGEYDQVLLVALTGYGRPEDRKRALAAGFDAYLVKPVDFDELSLVLNHGPKRKLPADLSRRRTRR